MTFRSRFTSVLLALSVTAVAATAGDPVTSKPFAGVKVTQGTVTLQQQQGGTWTLTLSADFVVPPTPAPHWQVVDSRGNAFLLQRLVAKDDKFHRTITVPGHVLDIAKVQIWCAFAETLLGEAGFPEMQR